MNAIMFGTKRAFHGFLRVSRRPLVWLGLTAARFDLLSVMAVRGRAHMMWPMWQSELRKILGVTAPVVSRMVKSLEALGLVRRERVDRDRRQVSVSLTEEGRRCILRARHVMIRAMRRLVYGAICFGQHRSPDARFEHMARLESYLSVLRDDFGDTAKLYYCWWHPDD